mgnify:CR=1 FL=1
MDFLEPFINNHKIKNVLIIDNLSYFDGNDNIFDDIYKIIENKKNITKFIISKKIHNSENMFLHPDKIKDKQEFFSQNNIFFDIIIDLNNSDYIQQLSTFSLFFEKTIRYIITINNEFKKELIYNIQKFSQNILFQNNYLIITQ